ncbi:hypothetical protein G9A89_001267 [Geosiphon pyriformis]|nr:hypothetical protein G9A89_001267 [Geosiphon pyriformis]
MNPLARNTPEKPSINPQNIAIATCDNNPSRFEYLTDTLDVILRSSFSLALAVPPYENFVEWLIQIIIYRRSANGLALERGVLSTGMIERIDFKN